MAVRLGFRGAGHGSRTPGVGGVSIPGSAITSLSIIGATPLLDATGDYGDATSRAGINGNGWVAKVTVPYLIGQTFDPGKIAISVSDPGYDGSGSTTVSRTITGTVILRRQYNAAASDQQSNDGVTLTVYFALSDWIYQGSTIVSATAGSGFYGASAAGAVATPANGSTRAYPKPLFAWLNLQHERATGTGFSVEAVAYHAHAMNGRQVARIEFAATDASAHGSATQTASAPSLSALQTKGNIVEAWKATIPLSALNQGDLCQVSAKIYPWIGDSSAVLDLATDGVAWPTAQPQTRLRFLNDKTGAYGGAIACVKNGASGGTVQASLAAAQATPYPTLAAAMTALASYNNANKGHNDHSGSTIYLMEDSAGAGGTITPAAAFDGPAAGQCWTDIRIDPAATGTVKIAMTATRNAPSLTRFLCDIDHSAGNGFDGGVANGYMMIAFDGITINDTSTAAPVNYRFGLSYFRNVTYAGLTSNNAAWPGEPTSTNRTQVPLFLGVVATSATTNLKMRPWALIGCQTKRVYLIENDFTAVPNCDSHDGAVIANNRLLDVRTTCYVGANQAYSAGLALVQNVIEKAVGSTAVQVLGLSGDSTTNNIANVVMAHNTIPGVDTGCRANLFYTDDPAAVGLSKRASLKFNLLYESNTKSDTFPGSGTNYGRVGNWSVRYRVGWLGNVSAHGDSNGDTAVSPRGGAWLGEWLEPQGATTASVGFTSNLSGTAGAGGGTYTLTGSTNGAYDRVAAGAAVLAYDLAGMARRNDGSGACGAYERTVG